MNGRWVYLFHFPCPWLSLFLLIFQIAESGPRCFWWYTGILCLSYPWHCYSAGALHGHCHPPPGPCSRDGHHRSSSYTRRVVGRAGRQSRRENPRNHFHIITQTANSCAVLQIQYNVMSLVKTALTLPSIPSENLSALSPMPSLFITIQIYCSTGYTTLPLFLPLSLSLFY